MAVRIPIITDFNGKGINRAIAEFKQLEGVGAKAGFALKKALIPATAALGALGAVAMDAVTAAMEDNAAQEQLARTIRATTKATDKQIDANEDWITAQGKLYGITDDDLRPALAKLIRVTKDVTKAQDLAALAMDVARGTGKDLNEVADGFTKALGGNFKALQTLAPETRGLIRNGADADEVFQRLADTFGGDAAAYAETAAGKFDIFKVRVAELKEAFGEKLLPVITDKVIPALEGLIKWIEDNPDMFKALVAGLAGVTGAIVAMNLAMLASPWGVFFAGLAALTVAVGGPQGAVDKLRDSWESFKRAMNGDAPGTRKILDDLNEKLRQARTAFMVEGTVVQNFDPGRRGTQFGSRSTRAIGNVPAYANGGIVTGPTLALVGDNPGGMEAIVPLSGPNARNLGGTTVNVTVNGGDPKAVVDAIVRWSRQNGPLPPQVRIAN